jgi:hypothetical protein
MQASHPMDEQANIENLLEESGKRHQAFLEQHRRLICTINVALLTIAAFVAAISALVWLL